MEILFAFDTSFYWLHYGILIGLFLLALFRAPVKTVAVKRSTSNPRWSYSIKVPPKWAKLIDAISFGCVLLGTMWAQWTLYDFNGWIDPWYWPLVSIGAAFLRKFPSFWWVFLFYFFHFYSSFDGPMTGSPWTIVRSPHGDLVVVQERRVGQFFRGYTAGIDEIFGSYICRGAIVLEGEVFHFGQSWETGGILRPRVRAGGKPGELEVLFCNGRLTVYPDHTYTVHRWGPEKRQLIHLGKLDETEDAVEALLKKMLYVGHEMSEYRTANPFHSLILYLIYPVFFGLYWYLPKLRRQFSRRSRSYRYHWILIFSSYLMFGIPEPVYWPLLLMTWAWFENRGSAVYLWSIWMLMVLWVLILLACSSSGTSVPWLWSYFVWVAGTLVFDKTRKSFAGNREVSLRAYQGADAGKLLELFRDTIRRVNCRDYDAKQIAAWSSDEIDPGQWADRFHGKYVLVAEVEGTPVGFAELEAGGKMDRVYVSADHQRMGIGRQMLEAMVFEAKKTGVSCLRVEASITAVPFFESLGFTLLAPQIVTCRGAEFINHRMERIL